jgi:hypothetical protein
VLLTLKAFVQFRNVDEKKIRSTLLLRIDNQGALWMLKLWRSPTAYYRPTLRLIWDLLDANNLDIRLRWVASERKVRADELSRQSYDHNDYELNPKIFDSLQACFTHPSLPSHPRLPEVDLFANFRNRQVPNFYSQGWQPEATGYDTLTADLSRWRWAYANPPWGCVGTFLEHHQSFPLLQTLVVLPWWESAVWWPLLKNSILHSFPVFRIDPHRGLFLNCLGEKMPAARWPVICAVIGANSNLNKALRPLRWTSWNENYTAN